ncbi:glycosyltransferase WbuB [Desertihabitans brevis]|uniref:Glycosyltransferase WbuB n=1 Tax=Desertihabitans brevis TaxID=2268447 RepID=A0A367YUD3_9ACTN|nr:glycosyltransferase family 4 protein [Desertihabitans brevis]RCK69139.1 glycosyltransferase WbuB [Desertihabitans brevis]
MHSGWRLLPRRPRAVLLRLLTGRLPVVAALGLHATGQRDRARAQLRRGHRGRAVEAATACGELELARELVSAGAVPPVTEARLLRAEGHLEQALAVARRGGPGTPALVAELTGELGALSPDRRLGTARTPGPPWPRPGGSAAPLRVLHLVSNALPEVQAGYTLRTAGIVAAQRELGLQPHVVTRLGFPVDTGRVLAADRVEIGGVPHHRLLPGVLPRRHDEALQRAADELAALVDELRPDLLHAHSKHDNAQVALAVGARRGLPVVYEVRGMLEETWRSRGGDPASDLYRLSREAETWCMRSAARVLTLGPAMAAEITGRGVPTERVVVTPNAVDRSFLTGADGGAVRARLGIGADEVVVGVVGTLNDYEGLDVLVRAAAAAGVRLLVVGDGPARSELQQLAAATGARALLPGRVPHADVPAHLAALDLFAVPRRPTPVTSLVSPLKPVEAMAAGLPLLVSDLPPLTELLEGDAHGWSAPAGDVDGWTAVLTRLTADRDELRRRGRAAASWIEHSRTWDHLAHQHATLYTEVVAEAAR